MSLMKWLSIYGMRVWRHRRDGDRRGVVVYRVEGWPITGVAGRADHPGD